MNSYDPNERLSRITTLWTLVFRAHHGPLQDVVPAQRRLLERYGGAVHRYLLGALRNSEVADELFQEFALRFLRGDFRHADPQRGRFRDFVKTAVYHLIVDTHKRKKFQPQQFSSEYARADVSCEERPPSEDQFLTAWRDELMDLTWVALQDFERQTGQPYHTVLRFRTENPLLSSDKMAEQVGARLGKSYSVHALRQMLHRSREKFSDLLLDEVERSLENSNRTRVQEELIDLGLLTYCRPALERRFSS